VSNFSGSPAIDAASLAAIRIKIADTDTVNQQFSDTDINIIWNGVSQNVWLASAELLEAWAVVCDNLALVQQNDKTKLDLTKRGAGMRATAAVYRKAAPIAPTSQRRCNPELGLSPFPRYGRNGQLESEWE